MPDTLDIRFEKENRAAHVADKWTTWNSARSVWLNERKELRAYLTATSTRDTTNSKLPWKNSTVTPKLTQIRDNLHANYMAALFPNDEWLQWKASEEQGSDKATAILMQDYMKTKLKASGFELVVSQLIYDYIDYGNVIAGHEYVTEVKKDPTTGEEAIVYQGPRAFRVSPLDVVFDPTASSFDRSPFIRRSLLSLGDLVNRVKTQPHLGYNADSVAKAIELRSSMRDQIDFIKAEGMSIDGFSSLEQYFTSGMCEILEFWGDIYDLSENKLYKDHVVMVIDRRWVLYEGPNKSWLAEKPYKHCGWRLRSDNLWAAGPLDQLVGMQYRIDHLENLKADVFDQIAHPIVVISGSTVESLKFAPGEQWYLGDDGKADVLKPDATALNADMQIDNLMAKMEEMAGAPKQAMGIRTPGEKTKYEVQVLENGAGRIFQNKITWFERNIIEPLVNSMLEEARRNLVGADVAVSTDPDYGATSFINVTKQDLLSKGKFYPVGARHFAAQALFTQNLSATIQQVAGVPSIMNHISGLAIAKAIEDVMGWRKHGIVKPNINILEQLESQRIVEAGKQSLAAEAAMPSELQPGDMEAPTAPEGGGGEVNPAGPQA